MGTISSSAARLVLVGVRGYGQVHAERIARLADQGLVNLVAAPIGEHFRLAEIALTSGADVYLEKPPVASMDDFTTLLATERESGHVVQVGFQSLGSRALQMLQTDDFGIGSVVRVGAMGAWSRPVG